MIKRYFLLSILCAFILIEVEAQDKLVPFSSLNIAYEGRIKYRKDAAELSWPGTTATIWMEGTGLSAVLQDKDSANYFNVIVDGKVVSKIHTDTVKRSYVLASGLPLGRHSIQLYKRTEWDKGKTLFYGFSFDKGTKILSAPPARKRKIEFYGNSITCGYAVEDSSGKDSWFGYFENNYITYASITARHFDAQCSYVAKSGIGITISWFPLLMSEMYNRLDPTDSTSKWDFTQYTPDLVVVNLLQNDSWLTKMPNHAEFKNRFGTQAPDTSFIIKRYADFVASIRKVHPQATIICALGSMDATREGSSWPGYICQAVKQLSDSKIYTHFFAYKNTNGHPNIAEQKTMANDLIHFIESNVKW